MRFIYLAGSVMVSWVSLMLLPVVIVIQFILGAFCLMLGLAVSAVGNFAEKIKERLE